MSFFSIPPTQIAVRGEPLFVTTPTTSAKKKNEKLKRKKLEAEIY